MRNKKGQFEKGNTRPPHKNDCDCFVCSGIPWNLGKSWSKESKEKMRLKKLGIPLTEEHKRKIGEGNKGKTISQSHKKKLLLSRIGIKHSQESKLKMSLAKKGIKFSEETKKKMGLARKAEKHWRWIKDRTKIVGRHNRDFHDPEYKQWRRQICNRDGWKCKINNKECIGRLEVHHILGWKSHPELRYEVNNGITLCHFHHPRKRKDEMKLSPYFQELVNTKM